jgi:hypothetical protein
MMGLTDRVEPWTRRFQRAAAPAAPGMEAGSPARASLRARSDDADAAALERRGGRFTRRVLQEQER